MIRIAIKIAFYTLCAIILYSCTSADPLQPDGPILDTEETDIIFDAMFTFQTQTQSLVINNTGDSRLTINNISISDNINKEFTFEPSTLVIAPGGSSSIAITFSPSDFIRYSKNLILESNFENDVLVRLEGVGIPKVSNQEVWNFTSQSSVNAFANNNFDIVNTKEVSISSTANINDPIVNVSALSLINDIESLRIINNPVLEDLDGLQSVNISNTLEVELNRSLKTLNPLNGLKDSNFNIFLKDNINLNTLDFLKVLTTIGDLRVVNNLSLKDFNGAENIITINGDLVILNNDGLESLNGLEGVSQTFFDESSSENRLVDDIRVDDNGQLADFCGLNNVFIQGEDFFGNVIITNNASNPSLVDLTSGNCN